MQNYSQSKELPHLTVFAHCLFNKNTCGASCVSYGLKCRWRWMDVRFFKIEGSVCGWARIICLRKDAGMVNYSAEVSITPLGLSTHLCIGPFICSVHVSPFHYLTHLLYRFLFIFGHIGFLLHALVSRGVPVTIHASSGGLNGLMWPLTVNRLSCGQG